MRRVTPMGGICSVGNLLRLLTRDLGVLVVAEFGYREEQGRMRLDKTVGDTSDELDWDRPVDDFLRVFSDLAITHYERVERVARERANALAAFKETGQLRLK